MTHDELNLKRLQKAIDDSVNSFEKKKENAFKVLNDVCDEKTKIVFKEELENLFEMLSELPLEIEPYKYDKRFINFVQDQNVIGTLSITENALEYYFNILNQFVNFKINKIVDEYHNVTYHKEVYVDGKDSGKNSSRRDEEDLPEITKMIFEIEEIIDGDNRVVEQNFTIKEGNRDLKRIIYQKLAEDYGELYYISNYDAIANDNGEIKVHSDCPRGFSNARKVCEWACLPKAKIEYKEDFLPYSILSNLEFYAKRLLCSDEFRGFEINPVIEDSDDEYKYIFLSRVNSEDWFEDIPIEYIPEDIETGPYKAFYKEDEEELE